MNVGCKNDDACPLGEFCNPATKQCEEIQVVGCMNDDPCPPHQRCNTLTGVCQDGRRSCTGEAQCLGIGKHCDVQLGQCVDCVLNTDCESQFVCSSGLCVDPNMTMCQNDPQCGPPASVCQGNMCVPGCGRAGSPVLCGFGEQCDAASGRCVPGQSMCQSDPECSPPATICESRQCIPGCTQIGGLQCTGGNVCNASTGRCEMMQGCSNDTQCGAPAGVCENQQCIPGCGQLGGLQCGAGTVCDTRSGRCVVVQGPCQNDTQCSPPAGVCESMQCVPGCGQTGGIQCTGNTVCNLGTGRCDPGTAVCTSDLACGPPGFICDLVSGQCVAGCGSTGCPMNEMCNVGTGHCQPVQVGQPLNAACTVNADCGSSVCFDFGGGIGGRCIASCGNSAECPATFTCYDYNGAKMCISSTLFNPPPPSFSTATGGFCSAGGECKSNFCLNNACVESCSEDSDCGGAQCKWDDFAPDLYMAACNGPLGAGGNGAGCGADSDCASGVCYGQGICGSQCGSTADCPQGNVCNIVNYSVCVFFAGPFCFAWEPNFVKACVDSSHGNGGVGAACTTANQCRSGLCYQPVSECTDTCSRDSDCPATHVCGTEPYGELPVSGGDPVVVHINVCKIRGY